MVVLGVAMPTVLLGVGWLWASVRERDSLEREQRAALLRAADVVRGVVDESLEELRAREDARPFYLYNHFYSPPDVLAVSDPVAVSPLARDPEDPRVVGYFQVEPGGTVRTPYSPAPGDVVTERERRVVSAARSEALAAVRAPAGDEAGPSALLAAHGDEGPPSGPLTVSLNPWGNRVAEDIQLAQSGSVEANLRVQQRGRSAPITNRNTVEWQDVRQQAPAPQAPAGPPARAAGDVGRVPAVPPAQQSMEEVDYTAMAWHVTGDTIVLHRVVSHQGTAVVQGVVLDRAHVFETWVPAVAARQALTTEAPAVVAAGDERACAARRPASRIVTGIDLCFPPEPLAAATASLDRDLRVQAALLAGLLAAVLLGAFAVHRASVRAEELSRQKSAFVSAVSHELRTPLTTLRMHAEMLQDGLVSDERRDRVYEELVGESARLARLVDNVLELSRLEEGRRPLNLRDGALGVYVQDVAEGQRRFLSAKGFELRVTAPPYPVPVRYDAQAVEQILVNLLDNAAKYAAGSEPPLVEVEVRTEEDRAVLSVLDRGPGIPESERERVFERFHRVERPETEHTPGTGIGLALVRDLARAMGGDVEVRAREGGGAEVRVWLPLGGREV